MKYLFTWHYCDCDKNCQHGQRAIGCMPSGSVYALFFINVVITHNLHITCIKMLHIKQTALFYYWQSIWCLLCQNVLLYSCVNIIIYYDRFCQTWDNHQKSFRDRILSCFHMEMLVLILVRHEIIVYTRYMKYLYGIHVILVYIVD